MERRSLSSRLYGPEADAPHTTMSALGISSPAAGHTAARGGPAAPVTLSPGMFPPAGRRPPLAASRPARSLRSDTPTLAPVRTSPPPHPPPSFPPRRASAPCCRFRALVRGDEAEGRRRRRGGGGGGAAAHYFWIILASKPPGGPIHACTRRRTTFRITQGPWNNMVY